MTRTPLPPRLAFRTAGPRLGPVLLSLALLSLGCLGGLGCATTELRPTATTEGLAAVEAEVDVEEVRESPMLDGSTAPRVWTSPTGRRVVEGTVDENGYVLPLDIRRPRPERRDVEPPSVLRSRELRRLAGAGPFPETRLGPDDGHTQNETSIDADGSTVVAGWNQVTDTSIVMGVARSGDGGATWSQSAFDEQDVASDPVVAAAGGGLWFFAYLGRSPATGSDFEVLVRRSLDDGLTWGPPVPVTTNTTFDDKPWISARGDDVLVAWTDFSFSPAKIRAARSTDGGLTFGASTVLADASVGGNGASTAIAPDGTYHVVWRDSFQEFLWISTSTDRGATWSADRAIAPMEPLPSSMPPGYRIVNLPSLTVRPDGSLVVAWNDQAFGDPDILAVRSDDDGAAWSAPVRVVDDASGRDQFFPWLDTDDDGTVHAVWYDQREDGRRIDVYVSSSTDGGATWSSDVRVTPSAFTPVLPSESHPADFIGDYNGIAASGGRVYPFYQDARAGEQDVYVAILAGGSIFADGFESGGVDGWSASSP